MSTLLDRGHRAGDRFGGAAEHDLMRRVDVGEHDVALGFRDDLLDLRQRGHHRGHRAGILDAKACHLPSPRADGLERILERERAGADQGPVLADRVAHDQIRCDPVFAQQARKRGVDGDHGRLLDLGPAQLLLRPRHRRRILRVGEHDVGQAAALEQRSHDRVGLLEQLRDHGLSPAQLGEHVRVLRALAGVQERDLAGAAAAAVDAACAQGRPGGGVARIAAPATRAPPSPPGLDRRRSRSRSARARAAHRCSGAVGSRWRPWRASASSVRSALASPASSGGAEHERAAQGRLAERARGARAARSARTALRPATGTATEERWPLVR